MPVGHGIGRDLDGDICFEDRRASFAVRLCDGRDESFRGPDDLGERPLPRRSVALAAGSTLLPCHPNVPRPAFGDTHRHSWGPR